VKYKYYFFTLYELINNSTFQIYTKTGYMAKELTKQGRNYSQWYNDFGLLKADLAETFGCKGLYGNQTIWICYLGKNAGSAR